MKLLNKKGMTLFELLAVIVILGIIAAIAFPTVNRLIENSRRDTFITNIESFISAAKTDALTKGQDGVYPYDVTTNLTDLGFDSEFDLDAGSISVTVQDGVVSSIILVNQFSSSRYTTDLTASSELLNYNFDRDNDITATP